MSKNKKGLLESIRENKVTDWTEIMKDVEIFTLKGRRVDNNIATELAMFMNAQTDWERNRLKREQEKNTPLNKANKIKAPVTDEELYESFKRNAGIPTNYQGTDKKATDKITCCGLDCFDCPFKTPR